MNSPQQDSLARLEAMRRLSRREPTSVGDPAAAGDTDLLAFLAERGIFFPDVESLRVAQARAERRGFPRLDARLGVRIVDRKGFPIHGDPDDPFLFPGDGGDEALPACAVLAGEAEEAAERWVEGHPDHALQSVHEGDEGHAEVYESVVLAPGAAWTAEADGRFSSAP